MSYDDGSEHDRRLIELFNRYGLRGSFHLNSAKLGEDHHVARAEVGSLYQGHEVSCHTLNHPDLTQLPNDQIRRQILDDKNTLEALSNGPVRGLAYPFGRYDARVIAILPQVGIEYGRTASATGGFHLPANLLTLEPTCHHDLAMDVGRRFLGQDDMAMRLLYVWGHSYELDGFMSADRSRNWRYMEQFCQLMHDRPDIHYATTIEIADYLKAIRALRFSNKGSTVKNTSRIRVWFTWRGAGFSLSPEEQIDLRR